MAKVAKKWIRNPSDEHAVAQGCLFDEAAAERVASFFRRFLRHSKGKWSGQHFELLDWQRDEIIYPIFGWKRPDGTRRFRNVYIEVPKKQGKSTLAAGVGLYMLAGDGENGAEVYSVASDRTQASIVHNEAILMVKQSPGLTRAMNINQTTHKIRFPKSNSFYAALSSDAANKEGINSHCLIIDELHAWKGRQLWDALKFAGAARDQPLRFVITTAGDDMTSVCREQHEYTRAVNRGDVKDSRHFGLIKAARSKSEGDAVEDDYRNPKTWYRANPSLGVTMSEEDFAQDVKEAEQTPTSLAAFLRYRLDVWSSATNPWLDSHAWSKNKRDFTLEAMEGRRCYGGLDLGWTDDMSAFVLDFPMGEDEEGHPIHRLIPFFWLPEATIEDKTKPELYRVWARMGILKLIPGEVTDYRIVQNDIAAIAEQVHLCGFAYDRFQADSMTLNLEEEHGLTRYMCPQSMAGLAEPSKEFERLILGGWLHHTGCPILTWQVGHVKAYEDRNGNKKPVKESEKSQKKIDGVVAAIMALKLAMEGVGVEEDWYQPGMLLD